MKRVFKTNLEKPERDMSTRKSVLMSFGRTVFYMEKQPTREPGFEFIPLYPARNKTKVWQSDPQESAMAVTRHIQQPVTKRDVNEGFRFGSFLHVYHYKCTSQEGTELICRVRIRGQAHYSGHYSTNNQ